MSFLVILVLVTGAMGYRKNYDIYVNKVQQDLMGHISLMEDLIVSQGIGSHGDLQAFADKYSHLLNVRITFIDQQGSVLSDSEKSKDTMDNHRLREEILLASEHGQGSATRHSQTLNVDYLYVAKAIDTSQFKGYLRLSVPLREIEEVGWDILMGTILSIFIGGMIILPVLYLSVGRILAPLDALVKAVRRISNGDYQSPLLIDGDKQIKRLAKAFEEMRVALKRSMYKLERRNEELELILSSMDHGIVAVDRQFEIMFNNEKFVEKFNLDLENLEFRRINEVLRSSQITHFLEEVMYEEKHTSTLLTVVLKDKSHIYQLHGTPIYHRHGVRGVLLVIQDVTEINKLENMRRDFVSNVTHELRTPLTSIRGFVDTLKAGAIDDEKMRGRFLDIIDIESQRLATLISDILDLSEIEHHKNEIQGKFYDVKAIAGEVLPMLEQKAKKKNIELKITLMDCRPFLCEKDRIKQLLINLIDNGIKYTDQGYVSFSLYEEDSHLCIQVEDSGIGIPEDHLERIFERFYRVDKGRSRETGGTGLGLSIVKHIVELYEGTMDIRSIKEKGTIFKVLLPYKDSER